MEQINKPKLDYVMRKETINAAKKDFFKTDEKQRRMIRTGAVKSLCAVLRSGKHFNSPFVVNFTGAERRLVDGNHRWEAIKHILETDDFFEIDIWYAEYRELSTNEERDVFSVWNIGTKQSADDFLKIYWDTIPRSKEILSRIPASIYNSKTKIKVKTIVGNHIEARKQKKFSGGYSGNSVKAVKDFSDVSSDDITIMAAYVMDMEQIFGNFNNNTIFWKGTPQSVFYRIWYDNRNISPKIFIKAFTKVFLSGARLMWEQNAKAGGIEASKLYYDLAIKHLKETKGLGNNVFKSDLDII